jgi:hypothetical protein
MGQFESGTGTPACAPGVTSRIPAIYTNAVTAAFLVFQTDPLPAAECMATMTARSGYTVL